MKFNEKINHILKKSGWKANRSVSVEAYLGVWEKYRFPILKKAITFVESFGEIILKDSFYSDFHKTDIFITAKFFPFEATENIAETGWIEEVYPPLAKENLLPVGTLNEYTTIMIGESGKFYGGYDDFFAILGKMKLKCCKIFSMVIGLKSFARVNLPISELTNQQIIKLKQ